MVALYVLPITDARASEELHVLAAGSLREVMGEIEEHYKKATGTTVTAEFGPSGLLRERVEKGEHVDLFASADMGHPLKLLQDGRAIRVAMFTRNTLCGVAVPQVGLTTENFLDRLLDPAVKLGTSTPKADPAGDYTWGDVLSCRRDPPGQLRDPQRQGAADRRRTLEQLRSTARIPLSPHSPRAGSTSSSAIVQAPSNGCRKWPSCRSRRSHTTLPQGPNTVSQCSRAPIPGRVIWRCSCSP